MTETQIVTVILIVLLIIIVAVISYWYGWYRGVDDFAQEVKRLLDETINAGPVVSKNINTTEGKEVVTKDEDVR